jgi:hypothetical protein
MDAEDICALDRISTATDDEICAAILAEIEREAREYAEQQAREAGAA